MKQEFNMNIQTKQSESFCKFERTGDGGNGKGKISSEKL